MPARFTLGKNERLKRRKVIEQLFSEGKSIAAFPVRVQYAFNKNLSGNLQAGFTANSRHFKRAADRNRIKRILREAWRVQKNPLHDTLKEKQLQLAVFIIYTGKELPSWQQVSEKIAVILKKLTSIVHEMAVARS